MRFVPRCFSTIRVEPASSGWLAPRSLAVGVAFSRPRHYHCLNKWSILHNSNNASRAEARGRHHPPELSSVHCVMMQEVASAARSSQRGSRWSRLARAGQPSGSLGAMRRLRARIHWLGGHPLCLLACCSLTHSVQSSHHRIRDSKKLLKYLPFITPSPGGGRGKVVKQTRPPPLPPQSPNIPNIMSNALSCAVGADFSRCEEDLEDPSYRLRRREARTAPGD